MSDRITPEVLERCSSRIQMPDQTHLYCQRPHGHFNTRSPHEHAWGKTTPMCMIVWGD